jgi:protein TonB
MLFERVYGRQRAGATFEGSTLVSLGLHLAALGVVAITGMRAAEQVTDQLGTGIIFFAPPASGAAAPVAAERITYTSVEGRGGTEAEAGVSDGVVPREVVGAGQRKGGLERGERQATDEAADVSLGETAADSVFLESQVDNPVAFDVASAAPAYPDSLRRNGVEGQVVAQFVVDTTGRVEVASFVLIESTHGRFTESVRHALPNMLFRPAELNGRKIKQLVQIPFVFKIRMPSEGGRDTVSVWR